MSGGNLGDLWFQLGVKDNTSKEQIGRAHV